MPAIHENITLNESFSTAMPENPQIYVIHIGKAGGTTLINSLQLGRVQSRQIKCRMKNTTSIGEDDDSCFNFLPRDSQLARHTIGYFHMWGVDRSNAERRWLLQSTNVFLFTVRDPIDRLISTYNYHRDYYRNATKYPQYKTFYTKCFPGGLDAMIDTLRNGTNKPCTKLGVKALTGGSGGGWHFQLNYQHYKKYSIDAWPNHSIAVIRTESMWEDLVHLDQVIGGEGELQGEGYKHTHGSEKYVVPYSDHLSPSNAVFLCCLIYQEMKAYQLMILKALNLDNLQKRKTLSDLMNHCQIKASKETDNMLGEPFSWNAFRHGQTCSDSLGDIKNEHMQDYATSWVRMARGYVK